jgi:hypothetical protein
MSAVPDTGANPFEGERGLAHDLSGCGSNYRNSYSAGRWIEIVGVDLPPNTDLPLGIYYRGVRPEHSDPAILVYSEMVATDGLGNARAFYRIRRTDLSGCYSAIFVADPGSQFDRDSMFLGPVGHFRIP